jgi:photosystem II stability/assembly factor-like uncharacterized protein
MRDALTITFILILLFVMIGYLYNLVVPQLERLGVREEHARAISGEKDGGIFRSNDSGRSWAQSSKEKSDDSLSKSDVYDIVFSPRSTLVMHVGTSQGLYYSEDGGSNWTKRKFGRVGNENDQSVVAIGIDKKSSERMYIAVLAKGERSKILKARDRDFYEVYSTINSKDEVSGIWVDSYDSSTVFAGTLQGLLLESRDFGESWSVQKNFSNPIYDLEMLEDDTRIMHLAAGGKIFKTTNQGTSWTDITYEQWRNLDSNFEIFDIAIDPHTNSHIYAGTNHGLFRSTNSGASFFEINLPIASDSPSVSIIYIDNTVEDLIYIGTGSHIYASDDGGSAWQNKKLDTSRSINVIKVKPDDSRVIFAGTKFE